MGFSVAIYRVLGLGYLVMFAVYFSFRALYSLGNVQLPWRVFVLMVEFFASMSVFFVVIMRLKRPWTTWVDQPDGTQITSWKPAEKSPSKSAVAQIESPSKSAFSPKTPGSARSRSRKVDASASEQSIVVDEGSPILTKNTTAQTALVTAAGEELIGQGYIARILIPCYKEDLEIVKVTILAALNMEHDAGRLFVYLCDDGADPAKIEWVQKTQETYPNLMYVTRPLEHKGHGKAGNLNYCLRHVIYPEAGQMKSAEAGRAISRKELVIIFDADMVAAPHYLSRLIPYFAENPAVVMVQTPQTFHNVPMYADFFDAHNVNFFQYMLPAMSAWNTTTCCGTNFVVAARALAKASWFPYISVTEDMHLAIKMLETGGIIRYHPEHLAVGEAPEDLRQIFQQRSRWAKGTIQILIKDNPLYNTRLNWMQRLSFFNACWSYLTSAFFNPLFVVINSLGIIFGIFPVDEINFPTAMLFCTYYSLFYTMIHFTPVPGMHYRSLWIVGKMGHFFSFMALKAIINVIKAESSGKKSITFKVTQKNVVAGGDKKKIAPKPAPAKAEDQKSEAVAKAEDKKPEQVQEGQEKDENGEAKEEDKDVHAELEAEVEVAKRDSSHRDIIFHCIMTALIVFVIVYGFYILLGGFNFLGEVPDERSAYQKQGIRLFCICWMFQFFIAYSLPIWYAYVPRSFYSQGLTLKILSMIDTLISVGLIIVTICLFQVSWFRSTPDISKITEFAPSTRAFWLNDGSFLTAMEDYVYDTANAGRIPVLVPYARPGRDQGMLSEGGFETFAQYTNFLEEIAGKLKLIDFPVVMVMEPDWMIETILSVTEPTPDAIANGYVILEKDLAIVNQDGSETLSKVTIQWDRQRWERLIRIFRDFAGKLPKQSRVYIDAGHPHYMGLQGYYALEQLADAIQGSPIRGIAINTANFYTSEANFAMGSRAFAKFGLRFVEDSSRNGGLFSNSTTWDEIDSCRFDPPNMDLGLEPVWAENSEDSYANVRSGMDARLWVKVPGESDGRLYEPGDYRECLINHNIACDDTCPEIPSGLRAPSCQCD